MARYRKTKHKLNFDTEGKKEELQKEDLRFTGRSAILNPENWVDVNFESVKALSMAIVEQACLDYREAWRTGAKNELNSCISFLSDEEQISLYTLNQFSSFFILLKLEKSCLEKYGPFEPIYKAKCKKCEEALKPIDAELYKFSEEYLMKERLTVEERDFIHKFDVKISKMKHYKELLRSLNDKAIQTPEIKREIRNCYAELKKNKNSDIDREKYRKIKAKLRLTKSQKTKVKHLNQKAKPWTDLLYA